MYYVIIVQCFSDDVSRHKTALEILVAGMKCTDKEVCYLYQEYEV